MSDVAMPPNESIGASKNKKKKEKNQPQPQKLPSTDLLTDDIENSPAPVTEVVLEPEGWSKECEKNISSENDINSNTNITEVITTQSLPILPPIRSPCGRTNSVNVETITKPMTPQVCSPGNKARERTPNIHRGQIVKPRHVPELSLANSMAELVQESIPSQQSTAALPEKIEWVQFFTIEKAGKLGKKMDVLLLGLARGFQLWCMTDSGEYEEVMSERQGPIRAFVPIPNNIKSFASEKDLFSTLRPQVALVDAFSPAQDKEYCTVAIISLVNKHVHRLPSAATPYEEQVCGLQCSESFLVVSFSSSVVVYETLSYGQVHEINIFNNLERNIPPVAIYSHLLAFAVDKIDNEIQSCGGLDLDGVETPDDYTSQVLGGAKAFKRTLDSFVETVKGSGVSKTRTTPKGIIKIVDLTKDEDNSWVYAHFVAHMETISYCSWSPDGRLLFTADVHGSCFNMFNILSHPISPCLGTVHHMYRLYRGNTSAKVASTAFSFDGRWLAVATNHGTTHVFAVCPFGGKPSLRTHGSHFTNRESRFLRSAGLTDSSDSYNNGRSRRNSGSLGLSREHPFSNKLLAKCSQNPRIGPLEPPVLLKAVAKIPDPRISTDNLIAWANDLAPLGISSATKKVTELPRMSLVINSRDKDGRSEHCLSVCRAETGVVFQYKLIPCRSTEQPERDPVLDIEPAYMWVLHRTKNDSAIPPPLEAGNSLRSFSCAPESRQRHDSAQSWIPQAEIKTYSGPTRRVWQGPQFSFFEYKDDNSPELLPPSDSKQSLSSMKSIPVVIGDRTERHDDCRAGNSIRIECSSSYDSEPVLTTMSSGDHIKLKISEAMREDRGSDRSDDGGKQAFDDPFDLEG
ncbi:unnamed protein product [Auanema sp. JU1783]|nr:unnamed protein product [Auanema sp. JU1783]